MGPNHVCMYKSRKSGHPHLKPVVGILSVGILSAGILSVGILSLQRQNIYIEDLADPIKTQSQPSAVNE